MIDFRIKQEVVITPKHEMTEKRDNKFMGLLRDAVTGDTYPVVVGVVLKYPDVGYKKDKSGKKVKVDKKKKFGKEYRYRNIYKIDKQTRLGQEAPVLKNYPFFLEFTERNQEEPYTELTRFTGVLNESEYFYTGRIAIIDALEFATRIEEHRPDDSESD